MGRASSHLKRLGLALLLSSPFLVGARGCSFGDVGAIVPNYTCDSNSDCDRGSCVQNVCAVAEAWGYSLVLRLEGANATLVANPSGFTFPPTNSIVTGEQDLVFPVSRAVEGTIRFGGDFVVETQISFRRTTTIAGLVDEVRATSPMPEGVGENGSAIDFRAAVVPSSVAYDARFAPTSSPTPGAAVIPSEFVGKPLSDVFPPLVVALPSDSSTATTRLDVAYAASLFQACTATSESSCTVSGRLLSTSKGSTEPEASLSVVFEDDAGVAVSTTAVTANDGTFRIRVGSLASARHVHVGPSVERPAYPDLVLDTGAVDPRVGGDVVIPHFDVIRFEGRVERLDTLVQDAVVRAVAVTVFDSEGVEVPGAHYETTVRSTSATAPDGAGLFALSLVRGQYDVVASESASSSGLVHSSVLVSPVDGGAPIRGVTVVLGPTSHFDGVVVGPDGRELPYVTVQALPERLITPNGSAEAYARIASVTADAGGRFDLATDRGSFDLVFSLSASEGLPTFVLPNVAISAIQISDATIAFPPPVALYGSITDAAGTPMPMARVSAYFYRPATAKTREEVIPLGQATANASGRYRLLVPSASEF